MKSGSSSKKSREDRRCNSALRGSSILRSRIERDISMSEDAQELFDDGILDEAPLKPNNPVLQGRSKRFLVETDMNREDFDHQYPTFTSPDKNAKENRNGRYDNITPIQNGSNHGSIKNRGSNNLPNKIEQSHDHARVSLAMQQNQNEHALFHQKNIHQVKPRDKTPIRLNAIGSNQTSQVSEKKIATGEEKRRRISALERYADLNNLDNSKLSSTESHKRLDESFNQDERSKKVLDAEANLPPNAGVRQNFRKNLYTKNHQPEDAKINDSAIELKPKEKKIGLQSQLITSFDRDFEMLQNEQVDVEEIHYFFVNFHQKSKLLLSKMK